MYWVAYYDESNQANFVLLGRHKKRLSEELNLLGVPYCKVSTISDSRVIELLDRCYKGRLSSILDSLSLLEEEEVLYLEDI